MSRSNPTANSPSPCTRWLEWGGKDASLSYYDKEKKVSVDVPLPFSFVALDSTKTVRGYNKKMKTGLYANEIRDVQADRLVVKFFSGGVAAEGVWADIKDKVVARSGKFAINLYLGYKDKDGFKIGCFQLTGCSMSAWFDFEKAHGKAIYEKGIVVTAGKRDTSGDVEFTPPIYTLREVPEEVNAAAIALDKQLQEYFTGYFKRTVTEKAHASAPVDAAVQPDAPSGDDWDNATPAKPAGAPPSEVASDDPW